jgi:hypothetical protein
MRTIRALAIASAVVMALPTFVAAQSGRQFGDAWFWGIKAGGFTYADTAGRYKQAPAVGVDWLITRTHGGLYISASQAFLTSQAFTLRDPSAPVDSGLRTIDLKNLRRLDAALMGFPGEHLRLHPYAGIGISFFEIADATPEEPFATVDQFNFAEQQIQSAKAGVSLLAMAGVQYRLPSFSVFGQVTFNPAQSNFILYGGRPYDFGYELGLRYNVGSSIDKD